MIPWDDDEFPFGTENIVKVHLISFCYQCWCSQSSLLSFLLGSPRLMHQQKIIKLWEFWRALEYSGVHKVLFLFADVMGHLMAATCKAPKWTYLSISTWFCLSRQVEVTILGVNKLGIACEKIASTSRYTCNILWLFHYQLNVLFHTYSTLIPHKETQSNGSHQNCTFFTPIPPLLCISLLVE